MNGIIPPSATAEPPCAARDHWQHRPDASTLPGLEKAPSVALASLNRAVHAAHEAVDRFSDSATPTVRQLGERLSGAEAALHHGADRLVRTSARWTEGLRNTVCRHPLAAVATALVFGGMLVHVTRKRAA